jgi:hypothetical protein
VATDPAVTTDEQVVTLEREVAEAEQRLDALERSIRAAHVESIASASPNQFDREALMPQFARARPRARRIEYGYVDDFGAFVFGALLGGLVCAVIARLLGATGL